MHAYQREKMQEETRKQLEGRRDRLRQLLLEEQDLLARELEASRLSVDLQEGRIRERCGNLKSAREEQRKLIAEQLLYEHWKKNNPKLREIESALHKEHVINSWKMQKEEKKQVWYMTWEIALRAVVGVLCLHGLEVSLFSMLMTLIQE